MGDSILLSWYPAGKKEKPSDAPTSKAKMSLTQRSMLRLRWIRAAVSPSNFENASRSQSVAPALMTNNVVHSEHPDNDKEIDSSRAAVSVSNQSTLEHWEFTTRPEIVKRDLMTKVTLDKRHARRRVKCVTWTPGPRVAIVPTSVSDKNYGTEKVDDLETFALKIALRGPNDKHCKRILVEKDAMLMLAPSPWHATLVATFKTATNLYMLLPYETERSVDLQIERGCGLRAGGAQLARFYTACALIAIEHMHHKGVVHRDVKPNNLLVDAQGYAKLCDYGLVKLLPLGSRTSSMVGTLPYLSPEMMAGKSYCHSTDLWSLGISTFEMLFGTTPFEPSAMLSEKAWRTAVRENILAGKPQFPSSARAPLAARLFIKSMLEPLPNNRLYGVGCPEYDRVKKHPFFAKFDWKALCSRSLSPPSCVMHEVSTPSNTLRQAVGTKL